MTDWICPNCRGGFPDLTERWTDLKGDECPWCVQELGEYHPDEDKPTVRSVVEKDDDNEPESILEWLR